MHSSFVTKRLINIFCEVADFFVPDTCSKRIFFSKIAEKGKNCSGLLELQKVTLTRAYPTTREIFVSKEADAHVVTFRWCTPQGRRVSLQTKASGQGQGKRQWSRFSSIWDLQLSLDEEFGIKDNVVYR